MAVITFLEFPGVTRELYDRVAMSLGEAGPPDGVLYHSCGPYAGGWRIVDLWETREAWDRFLDSEYLPAMRAQGGPEPSRREVTPAHHAGEVRRA